ncbi:uncharacterized protein LOC123444281 [Hordeum vulgare subsp. vulgare]|uniref:Uncharacterized protein n=1 Tax=Hordeum vulgare subsp. vulgare TaxID=112509 RepID=A0A8I6WE61_HORVV|nr:uncharacterized protein LOC123444281 [Hordeum vulgare subsp. vulgare]
MASVPWADLEAAIAALPGRKQRLRESYDRLVARAPPDLRLPFAWDDIDAHVSSLHASFSLRFRQMMLQQQRPHPAVPSPATATHDDQQPHPATPEDVQPHPGATVSPAHDDEEMVFKDEDASPVQEDDGVGKDREGEEMVIKDEDVSTVQEDDDVGKDMEDTGMGGFEGATSCHAAGGTRDQEFPVPMGDHGHGPDAGNRMLRQPYMAFPPPTDVLSRQLNLAMLQRQPPYMPHLQGFPAMNTFNIPPMVQQMPYFNIPPMMQQPPYFRQEFLPDFSQKFFPDVMMGQPPMGIDHALQQQYMAMAHHQHRLAQQQYMAIAQHQRCFPQQQYMAIAQHQHCFQQQQQYMAQHEHRFPAAQAASAHGQGSNAKRGRPCRTTDMDAMNVLVREPIKKSRPIQHDVEPKPINKPIQKKTMYDYF